MSPYIYIGLVAAGVIGAGITDIINAGPDPED